jgi:lipoprotein-releasing system ATP-binding protein
MPTENTFEIDELHAGYQNREVLRVQDLHLQRGHIVFLVGPSGIGKSTMLESLGLMNNAFTHEAPQEAFYCNSERRYQLSSIWGSDPRNIISLRRQSYSFLFQTDNLLDEFSGMENILISSMFTGAQELEVIRSKALSYAGRLGLDSEILQRDLNTLSGGERQRLALIRALVKSYDVLFCDEPTGNVDRLNADRLFQIIQEIVQNEDKLCIVVSHDYTLAVKWADMICCIRREGGIGVLSSDDVLKKRQDGWYDHKGILISNPEDHIFLKLQ